MKMVGVRKLLAKKMMDDRTRVRDRSWDRDKSEDKEVRLEGRNEQEILMR